MTEMLDMRRAVWEALDEELAADERVVFFGEDVAGPGGVFQVTPGLRERHGAARVFDTPISELAMASAAFGSAAAGLRPVIEVMFADFLPLVMDSLVNQAAKFRFFSNGAGSAPLVVRSTVGGGGRFGAIHSQIPTPWFQAVPGLKIVAPATPNDAKGLLRAAIRDDDPVLFLEHKRLYTLKQERSDEPVAIGRARVARSGSDLTIVASMKGVHDSLTAAETLAGDGVDAEVIDLRTVRPLDVETIVGSVQRTGRLLVVDEGPRTGGGAAEVLALAMEHCLGDLDDAWRLTTPDLPLPYSPPLEDAHLPGADAIVAAVRRRAGIVI
jgi:pyruvate/2-oxoglutarate/acetoin dehydrogenase E1 component